VLAGSFSPLVKGRVREGINTEEFTFSLAPEVSLKEEEDGYYLVSGAPLKALRINESLYRLLGYMQAGGGMDDFISRNPVVNQEVILKVLLMLVGGGYLTLEKVEASKDFPFVSIIIPVRDDFDNIAKCVKSLGSLHYPKDRFEIIIIDDGSKSSFSFLNINVIRNKASKGPAACRNIGAGAAKGDILAFLDADCVADENWLSELVPFFRATGVGAVGGFIDGYYKVSSLERYENSFSSLNMGNRFIMEAKSTSSFYVPTANLLVRKDALKTAEGFNEDMHIGEDVDFCWRLRNLEYTLVYTPAGKVSHKHRSQLDKMLKRRMEYGSSEASLYSVHWDKQKTFGVSLFPALSLLALTLFALIPSLYPLLALPLLYLTELGFKTRDAVRKKLPFSLPQLAASVLRSQSSFLYYAFYHLARYYLAVFIIFWFIWHPVWILGTLVLLWTSLVDFLKKKPMLSYPVFLFYYFLEQLAYQAGVFYGCIKHRYFSTYKLTFKRA
jgi:mycofactocin glycosyltransferase